MADRIGLEIVGDDDANTLEVQSVLEADGGWSIYNVLRAGGGDDKLDGRPTEESAPDFGVQLFGEDGDDILLDSSNDDTLNGGIGDDEISYSGGADVIDGGDGTDVLLLNAGFVSALNFAASMITGIEELNISGTVEFGSIDLSALDSIRWGHSSDPKLIFTGQAQVSDLVLLARKDLWEFVGSDFDDVLDVSTSSATVDIRGGLGADTIKGGLLKSSLYGDAGDDTVVGGVAVDHIEGNDGNDLIDGGGGNDYISGGAGNNTLAGGDGDDVLSATAGSNLVDGGSGKDWILGGAGNDVLRGGADNDEISAGKGKNKIDGGDGDDKLSFATGVASDKQTVWGGDGDDVITGANKGGASLVIHGGAGEDEFLASNGSLSNIRIDGVETLSLSRSVKGPIGTGLLENFDHVLGLTKSMVLTFTSKDEFVWLKGWKATAEMELIGSSKSDHIDMTQASGSHWAVDGGAGNDFIVASSVAAHGTLLEGGKGNDSLVGGKQTDVLDGGAGDDTLNGGLGSNILKCDDGGADTIVVGKHSGSDFVEGFAISGDGQDFVDLSDVASIKNFKDVMTHAHEFSSAIWPGHSGVGFDLSAKGALFLDGITVDDLKESLFIF